jgi:hypothetical protein
MPLLISLFSFLLPHVINVLDVIEYFYHWSKENWNELGGDQRMFIVIAAILFSASIIIWKQKQNNLNVSLLFVITIFTQILCTLACSISLFSYTNPYLLLHSDFWSCYTCLCQWIHAFNVLAVKKGDIAYSEQSRSSTYYIVLSVPVLKISSEFCNVKYN